jgi:hypothetical protein
MPQFSPNTCYQQFLFSHQLKSKNMSEQKLKALEMCKKYSCWSYAEWYDDKNNQIDRIVQLKEIVCDVIDDIISACEFNYVEMWNTNWWNKVKEEVNNLTEKEIIENE